ncbi:hypothetical protein ACX0G9_22465 [Flavitalea flava]
MNKNLRSGSFILPALFALVTVSTFALSGCGGGSGAEPPINEDSVKPHAIPIAVAAKYTEDFRNNIDSFNKNCPKFAESMHFGKAEAFNSDVFRVLLRQKDSTGKLAAGIRIYYGLDEKGTVKFVMVPYDENGADILHHLISTDEKQVPGVSPAKTEALVIGGAQAMEMGQLCPTLCSPPNPINPR